MSTRSERSGPIAMVLRHTALVLWLIVGVACAPVAIRGQPEPQSIEVADAEIAANIKFAFHERNLEGHEYIKVSVVRGDVVLRGRATAATAARAVEMARSVEGVKSARSEVTPVD